MSSIETCLATDNPLRNLLSVAWQRTTDYVPGTIFAPGTILTWHSQEILPHKFVRRFAEQHGNRRIQLL